MVSPNESALAALLDAKNPFGRALTNHYLDEIDALGFWNADPALAHCAAVAQQKGCSRWGLLNALMAHRLSHVPPNVVLVDSDGTAGTSLYEGTSLNHFGMLVARTGGGKSKVIRPASALIPSRTTPIPSGTGQGIVAEVGATTWLTKDDEGKPLEKALKVTTIHSPSITIHSTEIDQLVGEMQRLGSQTMAMLRNLWVGETCGMTNMDIKRKVQLPANSCRLSALYGAQQTAAAPILAEYQKGTPQRWLWTPLREYRTNLQTLNPIAGFKYTRPAICDVANDPTIAGGSSSDAYPALWEQLPETYVEGRMELAAPVWVYWSAQMQRDIPALQAAIDAADTNPYGVRTQAEKDAALSIEVESHFILARIKAAAAIAFVCGRSAITDTDWQLSEILMLVCRAELSGVFAISKEQALAEADSRGNRRGRENTAAKRFERNAFEREIEPAEYKVEEVLREHKKNGGTGMVMRDIYRKAHLPADVAKGVIARMSTGPAARRRVRGAPNPADITNPLYSWIDPA